MAAMFSSVLLVPGLTLNPFASPFYPTNGSTSKLNSEAVPFFPKSKTAASSLNPEAEPFSPTFGATTPAKELEEEEQAEDSHCAKLDRDLEMWFGNSKTLSWEQSLVDTDSAFNITEDDSPEWLLDGDQEPQPSMDSLAADALEFARMGNTYSHFCFQKLLPIH